MTSKLYSEKHNINEYATYSAKHNIEEYATYYVLMRYPLSETKQNHTYRRYYFHPIYGKMWTRNSGIEHTCIAMCDKIKLLSLEPR